MAGLALVCLLWLRSAVRGGRAVKGGAGRQPASTLRRPSRQQTTLGSRHLASRPALAPARRPPILPSAGNFPSWSRPTPRRPQASSATGLDRRVDRWTLTINDHRAGMHKAAILVASLDAAAAGMLLDQLGPEQAERVRQAAAAMDEVEAEERQRVIDEFCRIGPMIPKACTAGIESSEMQPCRWARQTSLSAAGGGRETPALPPFDFLREAEEARLAHLLADERPATIALVLSHLPPEQGGEVLARLAPALQIEVVRRLVDLEDADPETVREVERALESRLSRQSDQRAPPRRRAGIGGQDPGRLRRADPRADSRQPRRRGPAAGRAARPPGDRLRGPGPVRRCDAAGGACGRRAGSGPGRAVGGRADGLGPAVELLARQGSENPPPEIGPSRSHPAERGGSARQRIAALASGRQFNCHPARRRGIAA